MSLATRCPACGTVFRVVQDQLRVSEGWVRCGRCAEVFNAAERLVEMPAAPPARRAVESEPGARPGLDAPGDRLSADTGRIGDGGRDDEDHDGDEVPGRPASAGAEPPAWAEPDSMLPPDSALHPDDAADDPRSGAALDEDRSPRYATLRDEPSARTDAAALRTATADAGRREPSLGDPEGLATDTTPAFVRQVERAQRWQRPGVRAALGSLAVLGVLGLAAQAVFEYRDIVAARWTTLRAPLERICEAAGCRLAAPRLIDGLVVDSSGLVRTEGTPLYKLSVVLRNRATMVLAAPAIDLSLTDARGEVVARKVLTVAELGAAAAAVPAGGVLALQSMIQIDGAPVTGYTIELFHP